MQFTNVIQVNEVISSATRELSDSTSVKKPEEETSLVALDQDGDIESWQAIVQKRIESKTKRYHSLHRVLKQKPRALAIN